MPKKLNDQSCLQADGERIPFDREAELAAMPRIGTSPIKDFPRALHSLEMLAFAVHDEYKRMRGMNDPEWWRMADILDDVMDLVDFFKRDDISVEKK